MHLRVAYCLFPIASFLSFVAAYCLLPIAYSLLSLSKDVSGRMCSSSPCSLCSTLCRFVCIIPASIFVGVAFLCLMIACSIGACPSGSLEVSKIAKIAAEWLLIPTSLSLLSAWWGVCPKRSWDFLGT